MNELQILVNQQPGAITTNFEDIKNTLSDQMQIYKELSVTEENKTERKKDVTTLRKMAKAVNDKKVEVKNEFLKPYASFEENVKKLIEIINEPIGIIDNQIKDFEEAQRVQKQEEIRKVFEVIITEYPTLKDEIGLVVLYDNRWENATTSIKSVKDDITAKLNSIRNNVALISSMVSDKTEEALKLFWGDLDITKAMGMITRYEAQNKEFADRMIEQQRKDKEAEEEHQRLSRELELERIKENAIKEARAEVLREEQAKAELERIKADAEQKAREEEETKTRAKQQAEQEAMPAKKAVGNTEMVTYKLIATPEEFEMIEMYLDSIGVEFLKGEF